MRRIILCTLLAGYSPVALGAAQDDKVVDETYGQRLKQAQASAEDADDLVIVQEMLTAAEDRANSASLRSTLARRALTACLALNSPKALEQAQKAMEAANAAEPLSSVEQARLSSDLAQRRLAVARSARHSADELNTLAGQAVEAIIAYAEALMEAPGREAEVGEALRKAKTVATANNANDNGQLDDLSERYKNYTNRGKLLAVAMKHLKDAQDRGDKDGAAVAGASVAEILLKADGDLVSAAEYLQQSDDGQAKAVKAAGSYLKDKVLPPAGECLADVEALAGLAEKYKGASGARIAEAAVQLCQAYQKKAAGAEASKARLLLTRLSKAMPTTEKIDEAKIRQSILEAYNPIRGKLTVLPDGRARISYDFSNKQQLEDWNSNDGMWEVGQGVLGCKTQAYDDGTLTNKIRLNGKKPFRITFKGVAKYELVLLLYSDDWSTQSSWSMNNFVERFCLNREGLLNGQRWSANWTSSSGKIRPGAAYQFDVSFDGEKQFLWKINGVEVRKFDAAQRFLSKRQPFVKVHLGTESSDHVPTVFDDVVIEGEVYLIKGPTRPPSRPHPTTRPATLE